jgi:hypothetical protein
MIWPHSLAASGEPITTMRSPGWIASSPRGRIIVSPRMMLATRESCGVRAWRSGTPIVFGSARPSTSNSTSCTWPSAKTSVWRAAGMPIVRETACAVSSSDETMKSTLSCPSRHTSRYSWFDVRAIVVVVGDTAFVIIAATRFASSRDVHAIRRSQPAIPASFSTLRLAPFPSSVATS